MKTKTEIKFWTIDEARRNQCWSKRRLAEEAGVNRNRVYALLDGRSVSLKVVRTCCIVLGITPADVMIHTTEVSS